MTFVLDASVALAWAFEDEGNDYVRHVLESLRRSSAIVPPIWALEIANVLLIAERRRRINEAQTSRFIEYLGGLPIEVDDSGLADVLTDGVAIARSHQLSSYDAMYLDLAMRHGVPLATQDRRLTEAARLAGVPLLAEDGV